MKRGEKISFSEAYKEFDLQWDLLVSDSIIETLPWINSGPLRSKCQESITSAGDLHGSVCEGWGEGPEEVRRASDDDAALTSLGGEGGRQVGRRASDTAQFMKGSAASVSPWAEVKHQRRGSLWWQKCPCAGAWPCSLSGGDLDTVTTADMRVQQLEVTVNCVPNLPSTFAQGVPPSCAQIHFSWVSGEHLSLSLWAVLPEGTLRRGGLMWQTAPCFGVAPVLRAPPLSLLMSLHPTKLALLWSWRLY